MTVAELRENLVIFDGTSHFVGTETDLLDSDHIVVFESDDFEECSDVCDKLNEECGC